MKRNSDYTGNTPLIKISERIYAKHEGMNPSGSIKDRMIVSTQTNYWIYAPGEGACHWDEFHELGIMGLGWDLIGDLNLFESREDLISVLQEKYPSSGIPHNSVRANFEFKNSISVGDVIFVKRGRSQFLGWGVVESDYFYDSSRTHYQKCRKVKWCGKGEWNFQENIVLKTLTNVTKWTEYVGNICNLMGVNYSSPMVKSSPLVSNPIPLTIDLTSESTLDIEDSKVLLYSVTDKSLGWKKLNVYKDSIDQQLVYELVDCEEYTYIMSDKNEDFVKIGKTTRGPEERLAQLRTGNPSISLVHTFPSTLHSEKELHIKFDDLSKDLEWFHYAKKIKTFIFEQKEIHAKIMDSYRKRLELDKSEREILSRLG